MINKAKLSPVTDWQAANLTANSDATLASALYRELRRRAYKRVDSLRIVLRWYTSTD